MKSMFGFFANAFSKFTHGSKVKSKRAIFNSDKFELIVFQSRFQGVFWDERLFVITSDCDTPSTLSLKEK